MKVTVAVYIIYNGKLLMVREAKDHCKDMLNVPGGHLEENENLLHAAIREVKEETGYDVELTGFLGIQNSVNRDGRSSHIVNHAFSADIVGGNSICDGQEISAVEFVDIETVLTMDSSQVRGVGHKENVARVLTGKVLPIEAISHFDKGIESKKSRLAILPNEKNLDKISHGKTI